MEAVHSSKAVVSAYTLLTWRPQSEQSSLCEMYMNFVVNLVIAATVRVKYLWSDGLCCIFYWTKWKTRIGGYPCSWFDKNNREGKFFLLCLMLWLTFSWTGISFLSNNNDCACCRRGHLRHQQSWGGCRSGAGSCVWRWTHSYKGVSHSTSLYG